MVIAIACWLSARMIPATGAAAPCLVVTRNPWTSTLALIRDLKSEKRLWDGTLIVSWFWLAGAVALSLLPSLVEKVVGGVETVFTLCLMVFAIGVAVGSGLAARASHLRPNLAVVPIGGFIMSLFMLALAWSAYGVTRGSDISPFAFAASANGVHILIDLFGNKADRSESIRHLIQTRQAGALAPRDFRKDVPELLDRLLRRCLDPAPEKHNGTSAYSRLRTRRRPAPVATARKRARQSRAQIIPTDAYAA